MHRFTQHWDETGVRIALHLQGRPVPLREWKQHAPASAAVLAHWPHDGSATSIHLSHAQLAALNDYEAMPLNLPRLMEAWMVISTEGRIDSPDFKLILTLEQQQYAHPWRVYERLGARLLVGQRALRLNPHQLRLFEALDRFWAAGSDVAARLAAWPSVTEVLHHARDAHIRVESGLPRVQLEKVQKFPTHALVRHGKIWASPDAGDRWAASAHHRYFLKTA